MSPAPAASAGGVVSSDLGSAEAGSSERLQESDTTCSTTGSDCVSGWSCASRTATGFWAASFSSTAFFGEEASSEGTSDEGPPASSVGVEGGSGCGGSAAPGQDSWAAWADWSAASVDGVFSDVSFSG